MEIVFRKGKKPPKSPERPVEMQEVDEKYLKKVILLRSPYLEKGTMLVKKFLNPSYVKTKPKPTRLPPIKSSKTNDMMALQLDTDPTDAKRQANMKQLLLAGNNSRKLESMASKSLESNKNGPNPGLSVYSQSLTVSLVNPKYKNVKSKYMEDKHSSLSSSLVAKKPSSSLYWFECNLGNNGTLVKKLLTSRFWWKDMSTFKSMNYKPSANLTWGVATHNYNYEALLPTDDPSHAKCVNRFENCYEISDKSNLFRNLVHHFKGDSQKVLDIVPMTFSFRVSENCFEKDLQNFIRLFLAYKKDCSVEEIQPINQPVKNVEEVEKPEEKDQPESKESDEKEKPDSKPEPQIDPIYAPLNHGFTHGSSTPNFRNLEASDSLKQPCMIAPSTTNRNLWMLKPSGLNRGKGLELFTELSDLAKFLQMFSEGYDVTEFANMQYSDTDEISPALKAEILAREEAKSKQSPSKLSSSKKGKWDFTTKITSFVIQKYIERPLLFKGHKFDLRVFALLTHQKELFLFGEIYARLSSLPYDSNKKNYLIHLCNNAVQVRSNFYGGIVKGNIVSLKEIENEIMGEDRIAKEKGAEEHRQPIHLGFFKEKIREIVKTTFDATASILEKAKRHHNFELFGYDFMIDENRKVWLIEVNSVPSLSESNPYMSKFMSRALDDLMKLTIDKIYPSPSYVKEQQTSPYELPPHRNDVNLWEPICKYA